MSSALNIRPCSFEWNNNTTFIVNYKDEGLYSTGKSFKASFSASIARQVLEWYYIVGPVLGCIVVFAVGWCICKRRRAGKDNN